MYTQDDKHGVRVLFPQHSPTRICDFGFKIEIWWVSPYSIEDARQEGCNPKLTYMQACQRPARWVGFGRHPKRFLQNQVRPFLQLRRLREFP
jgi:hypothetical protein